MELHRRLQAENTLHREMDGWYSQRPRSELVLPSMKKRETSHAQTDVEATEINADIAEW